VTDAVIQKPTSVPRKDSERQYFPSNSYSSRFRHPNLARLKTILSGNSFETIKRIGIIVIIVQLLIYCVFSFIEYSRFDETWDFSIYNQAWYLIAHGNLNPFVTTLAYPFWRNHAEFIMWPLSLLYWIFPSPSTLLYVQDITVVSGELAAFLWIADRLSKRGKVSNLQSTILLVGLLMLVLNPWTLWSIGFDFHTETLAPSAVIMAAWNFDKGRKRAWIWVLIVIAFGDVEATYLAGLAASLFLAKKGWRNPRILFDSIILFGLGVGWLMFISAVGGDKGSGLVEGYSYLVQSGQATGQLSSGKLLFLLATHPVSSIGVLWHRRNNIYGNLAPEGLIGFFTPWGFGVPFIGLIENNLHQYGLFGVPGFQSMIIYGFAAVGTTDMLSYLVQSRGVRRFLTPKKIRMLPRSVNRLINLRLRTIITLLSGFLILNSLIWAIIWYPAGVSHWIRVPAATAGELDKISQIIATQGHDDEIIVDQGVAGHFSGRQNVHLIMGPGNYPLDTPVVWFIMTPYAGVEINSVASQLGMINEIANEPGAHLVAHGDGAWLFKWTHPRKVTEIDFPQFNPIVAAWGANSNCGEPELNGPPETWRLKAYCKKAGLEMWGVYWKTLYGKFQISATLEIKGKPVNFEVWDVFAHQIVLRRVLQGSEALTTYNFDFNVSGIAPLPVFQGIGPFVVHPLGSNLVNELECKIWSPGGSSITVYSINLQQISGAAPYGILTQVVDTTPPPNINQ
jgi:hypothetical protein